MQRMTASWLVHVGDEASSGLAVGKSGGGKMLVEIGPAEAVQRVWSSGAAPCGPARSTAAIRRIGVANPATQEQASLAIG